MSDETWGVKVKERKEFEQREVPPEGAIPARICAMIDVGTHTANDFKTGQPYDRQVVILAFELAEKDSAGKSLYMARDYNLTMDLMSNLYAIAKALNGDLKIGEDLKPSWFSNKPCLLQVTHETKEPKRAGNKPRTYANITSVMSVPKGLATPKGQCIVWRVGGSTPLPDTSHLPPLWHQHSGQMLTIPEWVACSREAHGQPVAIAPPKSNGPTQKPAQSVTQAEVDIDIPF